MNNSPSKHPRVLSIAPSSRGFGFAIFEGQGTLVDWGIKSAEGDKNNQCIAKAKKMIVHYQPGVMVMEDHSDKDSRRSLRIRKLSERMVALASSFNVSIILYSHKQVRQIFFADREGTKYELAEIVAGRFPEELGSQLPPKRKPWESEDCRMGIFDAVALCLAFQSEGRKVLKIAATRKGNL